MSELGEWSDAWVIIVGSKSGAVPKMRWMKGEMEWCLERQWQKERNKVKKR